MKRDPWYYGTWEGARVSMHEQNLRLTLAEKIRILEDMEQLAVRIHCQRHRAGLPVDAKILPLIEACGGRGTSSVPSETRRWIVRALIAGAAFSVLVFQLSAFFL